MLLQYFKATADARHLHTVYFTAEEFFSGVNISKFIAGSLNPSEGEDLLTHSPESRK